MNYYFILKKFYKFLGIDNKDYLHKMKSKLNNFN